MTTFSTSVGAIPARPIASLKMVALSSPGSKPDSEPPKVPMAVRAPLTM
jgi:hypothetical protein